jgi:hypothetical protein
MIPEDIMSDWIDRLTIRTFNEELKTAFPYIFKLVSETDIPVKELSADDLLGEGPNNSAEYIPKDYQTKEPLKKGPDGKWRNSKGEERDGLHGGPVSSTGAAQFRSLNLGNLSKPTRETIEDQFESFMDSLVNEDADPQLGDNALFSPNKDTQRAAIDKFNEIMKTELKGGPEGINIVDSLKGLIDDPEFLDNMKDIDPDLDARGAIQQELNAMAEINPEIARILPDLNFAGDGSEIGGEELPPAAPPVAPEMPPAAPAPEAVPPAMPPEAGAVPPEAVPPAAPVAESTDDLPWHTDDEDKQSHFKKPHNPNRTGRDSAKALSHAGLLKAIQMAKKAGAGLDTKLDFGHKQMTLHDCIRECGLTPMECGFDDDSENSGNPVEQMLKSIAGFWNKEERNFTIGGTRAKVKIIKDFKNGEFKGATPEDVKQVLALVDKMDPSSEHNQELGHIKHLSGIHGMHPQAVEIEIGGSGQINPHDMMKSIMGSMNESDELTTMLKIAGLK